MEGAEYEGYWVWVCANGSSINRSNISKRISKIPRAKFKTSLLLIIELYSSPKFGLHFIHEIALNRDDCRDINTVDGAASKCKITSEGERMGN